MPILQEHQAAVTDTTGTGPSEYSPSTEEKLAIKLVKELFHRAKEARKKKDEKWLDYYKFFRGRQWKESRPTYRHSEAINMVFQSIQAVVPIMTDSRPQFDFLPQDPSDFELSKILSEIANSDWEKNNWLDVITECIYDAHIFGAGIAEVGFDPDAENGLGGITLESTDPFYVYPDPNGPNVNHRKTNYMIEAKPVDLDILKKKYPKFKEFLKADVDDFHRVDKQDLSKVKYKSPTDTKVIMEGQSRPDIDNPNQAMEITCYVKDATVIEEEIKKNSPDGSEKKSFRQRLKYPRGRKLVIVAGVLVEDDHIEDEEGLFPYARVINYSDSREFFGLSEIEQLESPQKIFNKLLSFSLDVLTLMGNPIWVVDESSGVDTDNLFNRPGLVIEKAKGSEVRREEGVQLQPYVLQLVDRMESWFQGVSGANEITQGIKPGGVTAASAISQLQEASQTRIRQKSRFLDSFLRDLGHLYLNRIFMHYSVPRIIRLTNDENAQKYFRMSVEDGENGKVVNISKIGPDENGQVIESDPKKYQISGNFDVRVTTGSALPFAKTEKANLAFQLFDRQALDLQGLLDAVDYPNKESVLARITEQQEAAAKAEAESSQGNPKLEEIAAQHQSKAELQANELASKESQKELEIAAKAFTN